MSVDPRDLLKIGKAPFLPYPSKLNLAHERNVRRMEVEVVQVPCSANEHVAVCRATVETEEGQVFTEIGMASAQHDQGRLNKLLEMAATRSKGRALRDAYNIDEEIEEALDGAPESTGDRRTAYQGRGTAGDGKPFCAWEGCGVELTAGQMEVSRRTYGRPLCPRHQQDAKGQSPVSEKHGGAPLPTLDRQPLSATAHPPGFGPPEGDREPTESRERTSAMRAWSSRFEDACRMGLNPATVPANISLEDLTTRNRQLWDEMQRAKEEAAV